jgi:cytochrome c-type protein NapB
LAALAVIVMVAASLGSTAPAQEQEEVQSLRGMVMLQDAPPAPEIMHQDTSGPLDRAYRQQPPLIPHKVEGYQVTTEVNQCMRCHDWPYNVQEKAPKISETHYTNREGIALDKVAGSRWFCSQCHVPQANARELVGNDFRSAIDVR